MKNNWPTTVDELIEECERLEGRYDLYSLGKPNTTEEYRKDYPDGTDYLAGEYQYGVAMVPAQWVTQTVPCLAAENARLRELLEAILQCVGETKRDKGCDACPMFNGDEAGVYFNKDWCLLRPTMRELGIEVKP